MLPQRAILIKAPRRRARLMPRLGTFSHNYSIVILEHPVHFPWLKVLDPPWAGNCRRLSWPNWGKPASKKPNKVCMPRCRKLRFRMLPGKFTQSMYSQQPGSLHAVPYMLCCDCTVVRSRRTYLWHPSQICMRQENAITLSACVWGKLEEQIYHLQPGDHFICRPTCFAVSVLCSVSAESLQLCCATTRLCTAQSMRARNCAMTYFVSLGSGTESHLR